MNITLTEKEAGKLIEIIDSYIRTWEHEFSTACTERWDNVAGTAQEHITQATRLRRILKLEMEKGSEGVPEEKIMGYSGTCEFNPKGHRWYRANCYETYCTNPGCTATI